MIVKKILSLMVLVLISISVIYGASITHNQDRVISDRITKDFGSQIYVEINSSKDDSQLTTGRNISKNIIYDHKIELNAFDDPIYLKIWVDQSDNSQSYTLNDYFVRQYIGAINWSYDGEIGIFDIGDEYYENQTSMQLNMLSSYGFDSLGLISQNFTFQEKGFYYFKITPEQENEQTTIWLNFDGNLKHQLYIESEKPKGFNPLIINFIDSVNGIIELNTNIWRISYYLFLVGIIISAIFGIVLFLLKLNKFIIFLSNEKNKLLRGKK